MKNNLFIILSFILIFSLISFTIFLQLNKINEIGIYLDFSKSIFIAISSYAIGKSAK